MGRTFTTGRNAGISIEQVPIDDGNDGDDDDDDDDDDFYDDEHLCLSSGL